MTTKATPLEFNNPLDAGWARVEGKLKCIYCNHYWSASAGINCKFHTRTPYARVCERFQRDGDTHVKNMGEDAAWKSSK